MTILTITLSATAAAILAAALTLLARARMPATPAPRPVRRTAVPAPRVSGPPAKELSTLPICGGLH
jgi:hypothetical protein